jgi:ATP-dependent Clp protease ATP-binding subunit ClpA
MLPGSNWNLKNDNSLSALKKKTNCQEYEMKLDIFTRKSQEAVVQVQQIASDQNHQTIEPAHLLLALIRQEQVYNRPNQGLPQENVSKSLPEISHIHMRSLCRSWKSAAKA